MAAGLVHGDAGRDLAIAVVEGDAARIHFLHQAADVIDSERLAHRVLAHARAGGVGHLGFLDVEFGVAVLVERAGVVVMQMRNDNRLDFRRLDADALQHLLRL